VKEDLQSFLEADAAPRIPAKALALAVVEVEPHLV
jgi:hypothetical protein